MRKSLLVVGAVLLTIVAVAVLVAGRPIAVTISTASPQLFTSEIDSEGLVSAPTQGVLTPIAGRVDAVLAEEGSVVDIGAELIRLDDTMLSLQIDEAVAALNAAKRAAKNTGVALTQQQRRSAVLAAQTASVDLADMAAPPEDGDSATVSAAQDNADGQVEVARIRVSRVREQLKNTLLLSDLDGKVLELNVRPGQFVSAGTVVATVAAMDDVTIEAVVADSDVVGVAPGMAVELTGGCLGGETYAGVVRQVKALAQMQQTQSGSRSAAVVAIVPEDPSAFNRLGASVDVKIVTQTSQALGIPVVSLSQGTAGLYVMRVVDGRAVRTNVEIGRISGEYAEVISGLGPGDRVVLEPTCVKEGGAVVEYAR